MIAWPLTSTPAADAHSRAIAGMFPRTACVAWADSTETPPAPFSVEAAAVARAVPSRQREFALGRWCARAALEKLGEGSPPLPVGADRGPLWPRGVVGSITHCAGFIGAVVARSSDLVGVGFDVEPAIPLGEDLVHLVCQAEEVESVKRLPPGGTDWFKVLFSAKEAIHKCVAPLSGIMLDFRDVVVNVVARDGSFGAVLRPEASNDRLPDFARIVGRYAVTPDFVFTSATIEGGRSPRSKGA